ncbi:MAG: winged helix-turn-helix domain-containing protein [Candidatus Omnitrophica bacterium]|nr:winged helix-turn-helix domain-containing protein [Candidatus Omnitrophota bacterium]
MITEIGIVAGEIWHYLDNHGEATLTDLAKGIKRDNNIVLMSVGWLAREGHVILSHEKDNYRIQLRKQ